jgi:hypothetical protein
MINPQQMKNISAQCAVIDRYIIHFPDLVERDEKPLNTPGLRKNMAQVLTSTEIEDTWSTVSEELLYGP